MIMIYLGEWSFGGSSGLVVMYWGRLYDIGLDRDDYYVGLDNYE